MEVECLEMKGYYNESGIIRLFTSNLLLLKPQNLLLEMTFTFEIENGVLDLARSRQSCSSNIKYILDPGLDLDLDGVLVKYRSNWISLECLTQKTS